ncbi:MAG: hypothetical protein ACO1OF_19855 [Adhaeribacter sp.]
MEPTLDTYPLFVANQVLKKDHLNELFGYLDEQNRLTRTNLIGIGIVCGLDVIPDAAANKITVTECCGITSAGYLVTVDTVELSRYQDYVVPADIIYPPLYNSATRQNKYTLWEMLPTGGTHALDATFWADKVVLIFVELKAENLKNCSPNSCDDRGSEVTVTFRYLLISISDADLLRAELLGASGNQTSTDLDQLQQAKALLKEIKLMRFDVPRQLPNIYSAEELFTAYQKILDQATIDALKTQLLQAYTIYKPLLGTLPDTVLQNFSSTFTYVSGQLTLTNPLEYQYYYDYISDLIEAYNELRAAGLYAIGICCPDENLFSRHLMLGKAIENTTQVTSNYRNYFMPSPLFGSQKELAGQIRQLFGRIIRMIEEFAVPAPQSMADINAIRITPSYLGREPLSQKALPFYYQITEGTPPLYELWNYEKTQENKAKTNLTYHADLYPPVVDNFVLKPLEYYLEPYNFFRIEGHVGLHWYYALLQLINLRATNRLPFDVVVLKTGKNISNMFDWHTHQCYFQDLETLFASLKEELLCVLCQEARYFYDIPTFKKDDNQRFPTKVEFLRHCSPDFTFQENTWGFLYETAFERKDLFKLYATWQKQGVNHEERDFLILIHRIVDLGEFLTNAENLLKFDFEDYQEKHQSLKEFAGSLLVAHKEKIPKESSGELAIAWYYEDLIDHLDFIIHTCQKAAFNSLNEVYKKRQEAIREQLLFGNYIQKNPGINHKAGVPVGGTFILVYAGEKDDKPQKGPFTIKGKAQNIRGVPLQGVNLRVKGTNQNTITNPDGSFQMIADQLPFTLEIPEKERFGLSNPEVIVKDPNSPIRIILDKEFSAINSRKELQDGIIIADFYLPYICCSDCLPIQLNIPEPKDPENCDLPCNGITRLCWYPLWLPKPSAGRRIDFAGDVQGSIQINDTVRNKSFLMLSDEFSIFYREMLVLIKEEDYEQKFNAFVKALNDRIVQQLGDPASCKVFFDPNNRLIGFEYYECFNFTFDIVRLTVATEDPYIVAVHYEQNGWRLSDGQSNIEGRPLGGIVTDNCKNSGPEKLCKKDLDPDKVNISLQRANSTISYEATGEDVEKFFWIFERGTPKFSNIPKGEIEDPKMLENRVWLLGVTENCLFTKELETLKVIKGDPVCDQEGQKYTVLLSISGGTKPYTVEGGDLNGEVENKHTLTFATGEGGTFNVSDNAGQSITITISEHNCPPVEEDCKCHVEKYWYPLWLPKPSHARTIFFADQTFVGKLSIFHNNGNSYGITLIENDYKDNLGELTTENFDESLRKFVELLNKKIIELPDAPESFMVYYDPKNRLIGFEHSDCFSFTFEMMLGFKLLHDYKIRVLYNQDNWELEDQSHDKKVQGLKVGGEITLDKCIQTSEKLCEQDLDPNKLEMEVKRENGKIIYHANGQNIESYFWILEGGRPLFSEMQDGEYNNQPVELRVWLLVKSGYCFLTKEQSVRSIG